MRPRHIHNDGKPQSNPGSKVLIARSIQPGKGTYRITALLRVDTGTVILDPDAQGFFRQSHRDPRPAAISYRVRDQIFHRPAYRLLA